MAKKKSFIMLTLRFTSKAISRESDERVIEGDASKEGWNVDNEEESALFPGFEYVSPKLLAGNLDEKILNLQDLRIRGFGNP